ncbi:Phospholipase A1-Igamma1 [Diplonema papillatum]|nr:Phospholipase A1-Igamma1 [Diplonema papillatum]
MASEPLLLDSVGASSDREDPGDSEDSDLSAVDEFNPIFGRPPLIRLETLSSSGVRWVFFIFYLSIAATLFFRFEENRVYSCNAVCPETPAEDACALDVPNTWMRKQGVAECLNATYTYENKYWNVDLSRMTIWHRWLFVYASANKGIEGGGDVEVAFNLFFVKDNVREEKDVTIKLRCTDDRCEEKQLVRFDGVHLLQNMEITARVVSNVTDTDEGCTADNLRIEVLYGNYAMTVVELTGRSFMILVVLVLGIRLFAMLRLTNFSLWLPEHLWLLWVTAGMIVTLDPTWYWSLWHDGFSTPFEKFNFVQQVLLYDFGADVVKVFEFVALCSLRNADNERYWALGGRLFKPAVWATLWLVVVTANRVSLFLTTDETFQYGVAVTTFDANFDFTSARFYHALVYTLLEYMYYLVIAVQAYYTAKTLLSLPYLQTRYRQLAFRFTIFLYICFVVAWIPPQVARLFRKHQPPRLKHNFGEVMGNALYACILVYIFTPITDYEHKLIYYNEFPDPTKRRWVDCKVYNVQFARFLRGEQSLFFFYTEEERNRFEASYAAAFDEAVMSKAQQHFSPFDIRNAAPDVKAAMGRVKERMVNSAKRVQNSVTAFPEAAATAVGNAASSVRYGVTHPAATASSMSNKTIAVMTQTVEKLRHPSSAPLDDPGAAASPQKTAGAHAAVSKVTRSFHEALKLPVVVGVKHEDTCITVSPPSPAARHTPSAGYAFNLTATSGTTEACESAASYACFSSLENSVVIAAAEGAPGEGLGSPGWMEPVAHAPGPGVVPNASFFRRGSRCRRPSVDSGGGGGNAAAGEDKNLVASWLLDWYDRMTSDLGGYYPAPEPLFCLETSRDLYNLSWEAYFQDPRTELSEESRVERDRTWVKKTRQREKDRRKLQQRESRGSAGAGSHTPSFFSGGAKKAKRAVEEPRDPGEHHPQQQQQQHAAASAPGTTPPARGSCVSLCSLGNGGESLQAFAFPVPESQFSGARRKTDEPGSYASAAFTLGSPSSTMPLSIGDADDELCSRVSRKQRFKKERLTNLAPFPEPAAPGGATHSPLAATGENLPPHSPQCATPRARPAVPELPHPNGAARRPSVGSRHRASSLLCKKTTKKRKSNLSQTWGRSGGACRADGEELLPAAEEKRLSSATLRSCKDAGLRLAAGSRLSLQDLNDTVRSQSASAKSCHTFASTLTATIRQQDLAPPAPHHHTPPADARPHFAPITSRANSSTHPSAPSQLHSLKRNTFVNSEHTLFASKAVGVSKTDLALLENLEDKVHIDVEQYGYRLEKVVTKLQNQAIVCTRGSDINIAFRGTCNTDNMKTDVQMYRTPIENWTVPARTINKFFDRVCNFFGLFQPRVHRGFYHVWNDILKEDVMREVSRLADEREVKRILITGHSLGGALAVLAGWDLARWVNENYEPDPYGSPGVKIVLYNFGCPRVGNTRFATAFRQAVPDAFRVVNDGDVVCSTPPRMYFPLFGALYCHAGKQTIVDWKGNFVICPSFVERALPRWHLRSSDATRHQLAGTAADFVAGKCKSYRTALDAMYAYCRADTRCFQVLYDEIDSRDHAACWAPTGHSLYSGHGDGWETSTVSGQYTRGPASAGRCAAAAALVVVCALAARRREGHHGWSPPAVPSTGPGSQMSSQRSPLAPLPDRSVETSCLTPNFHSRTVSVTSAAATPSKGLPAKWSFQSLPNGEHTPSPKANPSDRSTMHSLFAASHSPAVLPSKHHRRGDDFNWGDPGSEATSPEHALQQQQLHPLHHAAASHPLLPPATTHGKAHGQRQSDDGLLSKALYHRHPQHPSPPGSPATPTRSPELFSGVIVAPSKRGNARVRPALPTGRASLDRQPAPSHPSMHGADSLDDLLCLSQRSDDPSGSAGTSVLSSTRTSAAVSPTVGPTDKPAAPMAGKPSRGGGPTSSHRSVAGTNGPSRTSPFQLSSTARPSPSHHPQHHHHSHHQGATGALRKQSSEEHPSLVLRSTQSDSAASHHRAAAKPLRAFAFAAPKLARGSSPKSSETPRHDHVVL